MFTFLLGDKFISLKRIILVKATRQAACIILFDETADEYILSDSWALMNEGARIQDKSQQRQQAYVQIFVLIL